MIRSFDGSLNRLIIFICESYLSSNLQAFVLQTGHTVANPDAIDSATAKLLLNSIFQPITGTEQDDEHENAPGYAESGQKSTKLVLLDRAINFLPFVDLEHKLMING